MHTMDVFLEKCLFLYAFLKSTKTKLSRVFDFGKTYLSLVHTQSIPVNKPGATWDHNRSDAWNKPGLNLVEPAITGKWRLCF